MKKFQILMPKNKIKKNLSLKYQFKILRQVHKFKLDSQLDLDSFWRTLEVKNGLKMLLPFLRKCREQK